MSKVEKNHGFLRIYFLYDRKLLVKLLICAWKVMNAYLRSAVSDETAVPGAGIAVQTYGDFLNFNPHPVLIFPFFRCIKSLGPAPDTRHIRPDKKKMNRVLTRVRNDVIRHNIDVNEPNGLGAELYSLLHDESNIVMTIMIGSSWRCISGIVRKQNFHTVFVLSV